MTRCALFPALLLSACLLTALPALGATHLSVGIVLDGPGADDALLQSLQKEVRECAPKGLEIVLPDAKRWKGDQSVAGVLAAFQRAVADTQTDAVVVLGPIGSMLACAHGPFKKPVIAAQAADRDVLGWPKREGKSGVANLTYFTTPGSFKRDVEALQQLRPSKKAAVLISRALLEAAPGLGDGFAKTAQSAGLNAVAVPVGASAEEALSAIPNDTDAVLIGAQPQWSAETFQKLLAGLNGRKIASFALGGRADIEHGALAGRCGENDAQRRGRRVALYLQRVFLGETPESLTVEYAAGPRLVINMATARAIGFSPTWDAMTEAELLNAGETAGRALTLSDAVQETLTANLDLAAGEKNVAAGKHVVREAKAKLYPMVELSSTARDIDPDRAVASQGLQPEFSWGVGVTLTQILYAEPAYANIDAQKHLQRGRELEHDRQRLEIVLDTVTAYTNVLRAKMNQRIQTELLQRTRAHLETAHTRREIGIASPIEVFRWESELATARKNVTEAEAKCTGAEIALNRLLDRPQDDKLAPAELSAQDTAFADEQGPLANLLATPATFERLRDFLVAEGIKKSPELGQYDAGMAAQERALLSMKRSHYTPIVGAQAQVGEEIVRSGKGVQGVLPINIPVIGPLIGSMPKVDDSEWAVGVKASLPLYLGGARTASEARMEETLSKLRLERASTSEKLEQAIRSAGLATRATFTNIAQSRASAEAARKTFDVAEQAYAQGELSMIELIDAQTLRFVTEQLVMNARYDYLLYALKTERASNSFEFLMNETDRENWLKRIQDTVQAGVGQ